MEISEAVLKLKKIHRNQELYWKLLNKSELALLQLQFWTLDELLLSNCFVKRQKLWIKLLWSVMD